MSGGAGRQMAEAILLGPLRSLLTGQQIGFVSMRTDLADLEFLRDRLADGSVRSVIDRRYPLEKTAEALAYLEEGHARGKVVLTP